MKKQTSNKFFLMVITMLCITQHTLFAQHVDMWNTGNKKIFPFGIIEEIESVELGEKRTLNIYLPEGYHPDSAATYPVIYLLDGSAHEDFPHIAGLVQFMNMYDIMPRSIVVGIANINRYRDFTYPSSDPADLELIPVSGGSEKFIRFVENELQPFIRANYLTNGHRTIIGQSLGGLLATEILLKKPGLFEDYIIVSPSLWWDKQILVNEAGALLKTNPELKKKIVVSLGAEPVVMKVVAEKLVKSIRKSGNKNLQVWYKPILEEDHATILHKAVYMAFEWLYKK